MSARIINGRALSEQIQRGIAARIDLLASQGAEPPGLAVLLIGEEKASAIHVRDKLRACKQLGIRSVCHRFPATISNTELLGRISALNVDPRIHGILVQLPLPPQIDLPRVFETIALEKDVDGFHCYNVGLLKGRSIFSRCTPYGVIRLLESEGIPIEGQNVVVVGTSDLVGKPMALMFIDRGATVAICHERTRDLADFTVAADILVIAADVPNLIAPEMIKTGATVIDVGINRLSDGSIAGDVAFAGVAEKAAWITRMPGGVGPMTVSMLLENTVKSAERAHLKWRLTSIACEPNLL